MLILFLYIVFLLSQASRVIQANQGFLADWVKNRKLNEHLYIFQRCEVVCHCQFVNFLCSQDLLSKVVEFCGFLFVEQCTMIMDIVVLLQCATVNLHFRDIDCLSFKCIKYLHNRVDKEKANIFECLLVKSHILHQQLK